MRLLFFFVALVRIDPDVAFRLCVRTSQFSAKLDDGSSVDVPRKCVEWVVDYSSFTLEMLELELSKWITWGKCQELKIYEFDPSSGDERELMDDKTLSLAFSEKHTSRRMVLFVDVVDKPSDLLGNSGVTEVVMSSVADIGSAQAHSSMEEHDVIDWDSLDIIPIPEEQIGAPVTLMDEDAMYEC